MKTSKLIFKDNDWSFDTIHKLWDVIEGIAKKKYNLDFYPPRFDLIDFEGMLNAYSTLALPGLYNHSSFGKKYVSEFDKFKQTQSLAFEVVINSNPSVCYLMESNTATMQALVIAHAAVGHSSFFKNNHMFKTHTNASTIINYLAKSSARIKELEAKYGWETVDNALNIIHMLRYYSFDKFNRKKISFTQAQTERALVSEAKRKALHPIHDFTTRKAYDNSKFKNFDTVSWYDEESEECCGDNLLKFIAENSPNITPLKKELIELFLPINQYLFPQMHTQLMNEGFASFWHYTLMHDLYDEGYINEDSYWEFLRAHVAVLDLPKGISPGLNPYKLGFDMYQDIKRISMEPTEEDKEWFPDWAGNGDWLATIKHAAYTYKDESFITQYLSPTIIRKYKFMTVEQDNVHGKIRVTNNHKQPNYEQVVTDVSKQYDLFSKLPKLMALYYPGNKESLKVVVSQDIEERELSEYSTKVLEDIVEKLWGGDVDVSTESW